MSAKYRKMTLWSQAKTFNPLKSETSSSSAELLIGTRDTDMIFFPCQFHIHILQVPILVVKIGEAQKNGISVQPSVEMIAARPWHVVM